MTEKYTIKEIEEAWSNDYKFNMEGDISYKEFYDKFMSALTKPKWTPQEGEVYVDGEGLIGWHGKIGLGIQKTHQNGPRALTPDEVPALEVAIEALKEIQNNGLYTGIHLIATKALAKIKELTND